MAWKMTGKPKTVVATKALAKEFAEMDAVPYERPLRERRLVVYRKIAGEGGFRPVTWARCYCTETKTTYRLNGHHTSVMLASMPKLPEFHVIVENYTADTLEDVSHLYATFDTQMQSRTARDVYMAFAGATPELSNIPGAIINVSASAIAYARHQDAAYKLTAAERGDLMLDHTEFVQWVADIIVGYPAYNSIKRSPVVAAMLLTWEKDPENATKFWRLVRDESGVRPDSPDRKLARWLAVSTQRSNSRKTSVAKYDAREFFVRSLRAWNEWRTNKAEKISYDPSDKIPVTA